MMISSAMDVAKTCLVQSRGDTTRDPLLFYWTVATLEPQLSRSGLRNAHNSKDEEPGTSNCFFPPPDTIASLI